MNIKKERTDDELPPLTGKLQRLSADHMYMQRSSDGGETEHVGFGVRDEYSGMGLMTPRNKRSKDSNYRDLKFYTGPYLQRTRRDILVKSDAAQEIEKAVEELGWHPELSLGNRWSHNTVHERWIGTCKSVIRVSMLQSGCPNRRSYRC